MQFKFICTLAMALCLGAMIASADSLELRNGSLIKGRFLGGTDTEIKFQVGSSVQRYNIADVVSVRFGEDRTVNDEPIGAPEPKRDARFDARPQTYQEVRPRNVTVTVPAGTRISVRTIDGIDSRENRVGDRFAASLEEPLVVDGNVAIAKGANVYGRLEEVKTSGTFTGKSNLRLALTEIEVNGQTVSLVTGEYEVSGKSKGASTAKRTVGGAAVGTIIGALAGGGKGAAIGAGVGGAAGAGSEIITRGDQVKVPSETLLEFTLQESVSLSIKAN